MKLCEELERVAGKHCNICKFYNVMTGICTIRNTFVYNNECCDEYERGEE